MRLKSKAERRFKVNENGIALLSVIVATAILFVVAYVIYSRIVSGIRLDFLNKAQLTKNTILLDEVKLIAAQGMCGITQLQAGSPLSSPDNIFMNTSTFPISTGTGQGLSSDQFRLESGMIFDDLRIDSILIGPYDHRFDHVAANPTSIEGRFLKTLAINTIREYRSLNSDKYLGMLYISSHPRAENSNSTFVTTLPVIITVDGTNVTACQSAFSQGFMEENCQAMGGSWSDTLFHCELTTKKTANDNGSTCPVNDSCNVADQYRL